MLNYPLISQCKNGCSVVHKVKYTTVDNLRYRVRPLHDVDDTNCMGWGTFIKVIAHTELGETAGIMAGREYLKNNYLSFCVWNVTQHH